MKYVGEAIKEYELSVNLSGHKRITAIGIAAWGCIDNRENLIEVNYGTWKFLIASFYAVFIQYTLRGRVQ